MQLLRDLIPDDQLLPPEVVPARPGRFVEMAGSLAHVLDFPATSSQADPALFLPGLAIPALSWTDLGELLRPHFDIQALDIPGFGRSRNADGHSVTTHVNFVAQWIEHSGRGPVHLFGNSLGGLISLRVAVSRPDLVRSLTLISPAMPCLNGENHHWYVLACVMPRMKALLRRRIGGLATADAEEMLRAALARHCVNPALVPPRRIAEGAEEMLRCVGTTEFPDALLQTLRSAALTLTRSYIPGAGSLWRLARRVNVPTLILWGQLDKTFPVSLGTKLAEAIPGSWLHIIENVGHIPHVESPRVVARAVLAMRSIAAPPLA